MTEKSNKELSTGLMRQDTTELREEDVRNIGRLAAQIVPKYKYRLRSAQTLQEFDNEVMHRFAEVGLIARVLPDPDTGMYTIDVIGHVPGHDIHKFGFDHEEKQYEVRKATERGEDYRGQKE
jgi:hypothetical protein